MKIKNCLNGAFTLIELLTALVIIGIVIAWVVLVSVLCMGNFWLTEKGVLKEIQLLDPQVSEVLNYERSIQKPSIFRVKRQDGMTERFKVDSNIMFNYRVSKSGD